MYKVYVDLDGVLVDLATNIERTLGVELTEPRHSTEKHPHVHDKVCHLYESNKSASLFETAPLLAGAEELWHAIQEKYCQPQVLSSTGPLFSARIQQEKRNWVRQYYGSDVQVHLVEYSHLKATFATETSILIDDQMASIGPWRDAGGIGILHNNVINTLLQLEDIVNGNIFNNAR